MSTWRERLEESGRPEVAAGWIAENYHYPTLLALAVFFVWSRTLHWRRFFVGDTVLYGGNDPFYHLRSVQYAVEHWPATMPFDPWTNFPTGTSSAQFGTLFDQLIATAALVAGLGNPSEELVQMAVLFAPVAFGLATLVPAYYIGRRLGGRFGGVVAAAIVTLAVGDLFAKSSVGTADHHVAEALFQALAVLGVMAAVTVAEDEKPVYELLAAREFAAIRRTLGWSLLAGVAIGVYLSVWPPGVLLLGILGAFFLVALIAEFLRGHSPEHVAIAGVVSFATAGVIALSLVNTLGISATSRSLLQPGLSFVVAAGCGFMAWLSREWEGRDLPAVGYPVAVLGVGATLAGALALLAPDVFEHLLRNVRRVIGFQTSQTAGTVGEAQPLSDPSRLYNNYKLGVVGAILAGIVVVFNQIVRDRPRSERLLIVVWAVFLTAAVFTQRRFAYYLAVPIASLNALLVGQVVTYANRTSSDDGVETYQLLTILAVVLVVVAPLAASWAGYGNEPTAIDTANGRAPGNVVGWQSGLDWMSDNTPVPGRYARPDGEPMAYLGTFDRTADFDYEEGAYGVLSWWDYGHWITVVGDRIPNANPFQQGTDHAAEFLLAQNESRAEAVLEERDEDDAKTRYVVVDWQMIEAETGAGGKFFAPPAFVDDVRASDYYSRIVDRDALDRTGNLVRATLLMRHKQAYYDSMVSRLYHYHGSAAEPRPAVLSWQGSERQSSIGTYTLRPDPNDPDNVVLQVFPTMAEAREYVAESPARRQIGGIGANPTERVPALEHYRLVHLSDVSGLASGSFLTVQQRAIGQTNLQEVLGLSTNRSGQVRAIDWMFRTSPGWTKTFERVPGGTIRGTGGPPNATVTARLELEPSNANSFQYTQQVRTDDDGEFEVTVPYASTGYDAWGLEEGYTDTDVRPPNGTDAYTVSTAPTRTGGNLTRYVGTVQVTEGQVLGEDESPATVTLEARTNQIIVGGSDESGSDSSPANGADSDGAPS